MPSVELAFSTPWFAAVLLVLLAAAAAFLLYRITLPPVSFRLRLVLALLRGTALALMLLLLLEPLLRLVRSSDQAPVLAVLVDNSRSMRITDRLGSRAAALQSAVRTALAAAPGGTEVRVYAFGLGLSRTTEPVDSLRLDAEVTNIAEALRGLAAEQRGSPLAAAVLITDGVSTAGQNPLYDAERLGLPLFTVGVGDSAAQKDLLVRAVAANTTVYAGTEAPVDVTVRSSGYDGERVEVTLSEGQRVLARAPLTLGRGTREHAVRLAYTPEDEGSKRYTVAVTSVPGELTAANNRKSLFVRVLKGRTRVLIFAGAPSPDLAILKQTLNEDGTVDARSFTIRSGGGFYEGDVPPASLDSADCLMFVGFPVAGVPPAVMERLRSLLNAKRIPLLYVDGRNVDHRQLQAAGAVLPFLPPKASQAEQLVFAVPTAEGKRHPVLNPGGSEGAEGWDRLPPVYRTQSVYMAKPEAAVLATARLGTVPVPDPLLLARRVNRQKSIAVLGYGLWRWRMLTQGTPETETLLAGFLSGAIRWLTSPDDARPVKVTPVSEEFAQGEPAGFTGQVYDPSAQPVDNAQLRLVARRGEQSFEAVLRPLGSGRYEGSIDGLPSGDYTFQARAERDGMPVGEDRGRFTVGDVNVEFQDVTMNAPFLRQLAARTGGAFFTAADAAGLRAALSSAASFAPRIVTTSSDHELWASEHVLLLIVVLLSLEWFLRKRNGML